MSQGVRGTLGRDREGADGELCSERSCREIILAGTGLPAKPVILFLRPQFRGDIINLLLTLPRTKLAHQHEEAQFTRLFQFVPD